MKYYYLIISLIFFPIGLIMNGNLGIVFISLSGTMLGLFFVELGQKNKS